MSRALTGAAALLALVGIVAGCGGGTEVPVLPPGSFVKAQGTITPRSHLFGDTIEATADVAVDAARLDPARISFVARFPPYEQVGETAVTRRQAGDVAYLRYVVRLRCLAYECITARLGTIIDPGGGAPRIFRFQPGELRYLDPGRKTPRLLRTVRWPQLASVSRINAQEASQVYGFPFRSDVVPLPAMTRTMPPWLLASLLVGAAALLLVLPAVLAVRWLRDRRQPAVEVPEPELSPLERALALVEWSRGRSGDERREALEALAAELDGEEDGALADQARTVAWRPPSPSPDDAARLAAIVKEGHGLAG